MKKIGMISTGLVYFWSTFAFAINVFYTIQNLYLEDWAIIISIVMPILTFLVNLFYKKKYMTHIQKRDSKISKRIDDELEDDS